MKKKMNEFESFYGIKWQIIRKLVYECGANLMCYGFVKKLAFIPTHPYIGT